MSSYTRWLRAQWDRSAGWGCVAVGAVLMLVGGKAVADAQNVLDQLSYLASAVAVGLFLLGLGAVLILTADSRDEWRKLDQIAAALQAGAPQAAAMPAAAGDAQAARPAVAPGCSGAVTPVEGQPALYSAVLPVLGLAGLGTFGAGSGVRNSLDEASALRWMQVTVLSVLLALFVAAWAHLRNRQGMSRRFATLAGTLEPALAGPASAAARGPAAGDAVRVVAGSALYHQAGCDLLRYSPSEPVGLSEAARAGLSPCQVCR